MDDAPLHLAVGIDRPDGLHKALQPVHTEQIDIQNSPLPRVPSGPLQLDKKPAVF